MTMLDKLAAQGRAVARHAPWPRVETDDAGWQAAAIALAAGELSLLGLWGDHGVVHMAVREEAPPKIAVLSFACSDARYPAVSPHHPPVLRLERSLRDLWGIEPVGLQDERPWLDHDRWGVKAPLGASLPVPADGARYSFLPVEGESLHQIPVGPVHAGIIEPGHFRFTANGETVVRLEERLGYTHKGTEGLMTGADLATGAKLAGRISGDSTVAYAIAFSRATEAASGVSVPGRAHWLRGLTAELERLANHFGDIGAICNDASFAILHAHCGILRERVLRAAEVCFGHRLMRDVVIPGGVARDLNQDGVQTILRLLAEIRRSFPAIVRLYDDTASLQDRTVTTGRVNPTLVKQYAAGGYVGRSAARNFDARRDHAYPPYDQLRFTVPILEEGDVNARVWLRIHEVEQSISIIEQICRSLPSGEVAADMPAGGEAAEGAALVEGFRGDILAWVRIGPDGRVERCHLRDPSWFQWPLLEAAIEGNIVADFPLCNKSFNCSYSGQDL
ncbi:MAG: NADH-quinone oxidoreductase subunit C [Hyphomicrobiales bacterium]